MDLDAPLVTRPHPKFGESQLKRAHIQMCQIFGQISADMALASNISPATTKVPTNTHLLERLSYL